MKHTVKALAFFVISLLALNAEAQSKKTIKFYEIDDMVKIFMDDVLVIQSDEVGHLGDYQIEYDLTQYIKTGEEKITVELTNVKCMECTGSNPWRVTFEAFEDNEGMDYQSEKKDGRNITEVVFSYDFYWNDL